MSLTAKMKSIAEALAKIEKQFGQGSIMRLGDTPSMEDTPSFSSGSFTLNKALGIGGYPRGRIVEIYGPESSGKTTLTLHAIAEVQRNGGVAAFIDAEHALDVTYAKKLGVNVDALLVAQPDYGEQALEITSTLVNSESIDLIIIDSVAALVPKAEIDGEVGDRHVGLQARMMSQAMRILTGVTNKTGCTIIFINQIRNKIGVTFGSSETTTGGNALKFYASIRLDIRRIGGIKKGDEMIGNKTRVRIKKNKMAPPFREAEFEIIFGKGINQTGELIDLGVETGIIEKSGAWYSLDGERLGNGRDNSVKHLKENPTLANSLKERIFAPIKEETDKKEKAA